MEKPEIRRIYRQFTPEERERWLNARKQVEQEYPEMNARHKIRMEAAAEDTFSGALRRALHRSGLLLPSIAKNAGLTLIQLDEFLTGERTLRSDVIDRLAKAVGMEFPMEENRAPPSSHAPLAASDESQISTPTSPASG